ncbi:hypothetical protein MC885_012354 [Smutsia gigantea]|nr:hypothetical protein MC885_012354 [Smutsia gigantea]
MDWVATARVGMGATASVCVLVGSGAAGLAQFTLKRRTGQKAKPCNSGQSAVHGKIRPEFQKSSVCLKNPTRIEIICGLTKGGPAKLEAIKLILKFSYKEKKRCPTHHSIIVKCKPALPKAKLKETMAESEATLKEGDENVFDKLQHQCPRVHMVRVQSAMY